MNQYIIPILQQWKEEAQVNEPILFKHSFIDNAMIIFTNKPGYLIGKAGCLYNKFLEQIKQELHCNSEFKIHFKEADGYVVSKEEDNECIKRLAEIIWELSEYGGDSEQLNYVEEELKKRNIDPDEIFTY